MPVRIEKRSLFDATKDIQASVIAIKLLDKPVRAQLNKTLRDEFKPVWLRLISEQMTDRQDQIMLRGSRVAAGNPPRVIGASSRAIVSKKKGNLRPVERWPGYEYGARQYPVTYQRRSPSGGTHTVKRNVFVHLPPRQQQGRIFGPAVAAILPRIAAHWSQSVLRMFMQALVEGEKPYG